MRQERDEPVALRPEVSVAEGIQAAGWLAVKEVRRSGRSGNAVAGTFLTRNSCFQNDTDLGPAGTSSGGSDMLLPG